MPQMRRPNARFLAQGQDGVKRTALVELPVGRAATADLVYARLATSTEGVV
jgi:hypothetical protein